MLIRCHKLFWLRLLICVGCLFVASSAETANAQRADSLMAGTRIRLRTRVGPPDELAGVYLRADSMALTLLTRPNNREQSQRFANIASLERLRDQSSVARSWRRGAVIGGIVGVTIGTAAFFVGLNQDDQQTCNCVRKHALIAYLFTPPLVAGTAAAGGLIAARNREQWERVPLPPR